MLRQSLHNPPTFGGWSTSSPHLQNRLFNLLTFAKSDKSPPGVVLWTVLLTWHFKGPPVSATCANRRSAPSSALSLSPAQPSPSLPAIAPACPLSAGTALPQTHLLGRRWGGAGEEGACGGCGGDEDRGQRRGGSGGSCAYGRAAPTSFVNYSRRTSKIDL